MGIREDIQEDMKNGLRARDQILVNTTRAVISEWKKAEIDTQQPMTDEGVVAIIDKEIKKRRDSLTYAKQAGRNDLIEQTELEIRYLTKYLGEQLDEEQLTNLIQTMIGNGSNNLGAIMGLLSKEYKGRYDGKLASEIAKRLLG